MTVPQELLDALKCLGKGNKLISDMTSALEGW